MTSMTPRRSRCCKSIVQGQTTDHSFTARMLLKQIHTKFSSQGNLIVNVKSQFIRMYWQMMWLHLTIDITITSENDNSSCSFTATQTEQNTNNCKTATHCQHFNTLHVINWTCVQCVRRSVELHTTTPLTDALVNTEFLLLMKIIDSNVSESTEKLTSERKSLVKQQILTYKPQFIGYLTAVLHIKNSK